MSRSYHGIAQQPEQVLPVAVLGERVAEALELRRVDVALAVGDLLRTRHLEALPPLERLDVMRRLEEGLVRAGVEPRHAASHHLAGELAPLEIDLVHVGDL